MSPMSINEIVASQLLDFSQKLDISLLDAVVDCMYTGVGAEQKMAEKILTTLKEHPEAWTRVDTILECSSNQQTKYYALQILENVIKTKWKVLPRLQCEGIKKFIVGLIIKTSSAVSHIDGEKVYLGKLNMILVQILKHEWPKNWPTFIEDIVGSSKSNESLCQNNMVIMKLLSEEVFDFSLGQMTQTKIKHLKDTMCSEFSHVFSLCQYVLSHSDNALLVVSTLETLLKFMHWIPLGYIFETDLIATLIKFLNVPMFRNVTLQCLTEIANVSAPEYQHVFVEMFRNTTSVLKEMLAPTTDIKEAYKHGNDDEQKFIQNLSLFYQSLFMNHLKSIEIIESLQPLLNDAFEYLLNISEVKETEIFKICLELWNHIVADLYRLDQEANFNMLAQAENNLRTKFYSPILVRLRKIMISRMARPEEVLVVENEQGEVVREFMKDTDSINLYKNMRECLVYLTHLDYRNTEMIMTDKLRRQTDGTEWSWNNLNTLCWAIGSISGAMSEDDERRFLVIVIRDLLSLCEQKRGKDNKAIVASNIMYVVGQYPRFLKAHWRFLKTVITKLFEFMHETHEGVQDMACDTFIKIAHKCRRQFVTMQSGEMYTFVDEILSGINSIISDLSTQQVHTFYEAMAMMVACETDTVIQQELIAKLFYLPNQVWDEIINKAATDSIECLQNVDTCKQLVNILKTNYHGCKSLGSAYVTQLSRIYLDMLNIYKVQSENINVAVCNYGEQVTKQPLIKSMRAIKKETLKIISSWIHKSQDPAMVAESFIAPMLDTILYDYQRNIAPAREPEVLSAIATIINRLHYHINGHLPAILDAVFECTLDMINKNMEEYPEHRTTFFTLLEAVNQKSFMAFASLSPDKFKLVLDSVIWAVKHTMRQVSETGLNILLILLQNVEILMDADAKQIFYGNFFVDILHHMFSVVTDSSHVSNLTLQCTILSYMFKCLEQPGRITIDLTSGGSTQGCTESNILFVQNSLAGLLKQAFPQLQNMQIKLFIEGLFSFNHDLAAFRENMRDFLVQIREYMGDDLSDLYLEEKEIEIKRAQQDKYLVQSAVPGILNPHELADDMVD